MPSKELPLYHFRAVSPVSGTFSGSVKARSSSDAFAFLKRKGFQPLLISDRPIVTPFFQREITIGGGSRLSHKECEAFCRELATLVGAGLHLPDALAVMERSLPRRGRLKRFVDTLQNALRLGQPLSEAVEAGNIRVPADLPPVLRAGEASGRLADALSMLAESYADMGRFGSAIVNAAAYPILLMVVALGVLGLIGGFVAPTLSQLFIGMNKPVPTVLAVLAGIAGFAQSNALIMAVVLAGVLVCGIALFSSRAIRARLGEVVLLLPIIGTAISWETARKFSATLRLYVANGLPFAWSVPAALRATGTARAGREEAQVSARIRQGLGVAKALKGTRVLPERVLHLIAIGESSGRLAEMLQLAAHEARTRFDQRMALVNSLLAPSLILLVGISIGTIVYSVFSALLEINGIAT